MNRITGVQRVKSAKGFEDSFFRPLYEVIEACGRTWVNRCIVTSSIMPPMEVRF